VVAGFEAATTSALAEMERQVTAALAAEASASGTT